MAGGRERAGAANRALMVGPDPCMLRQERRSCSLKVVCIFKSAAFTCQLFCGVRLMKIKVGYDVYF